VSSDKSFITYEESSLAGAVSEAKDSDCSCRNFIKEVRYKFYITPREPKTGISTQTQYAID